MDFTGVISVIDSITIVLAIMAIAAIKILPGVARWGFEKVINWFGGSGLSDEELSDLRFQIKTYLAYREDLTASESSEYWQDLANRYTGGDLEILDIHRRYLDD